MAVTFLTGAASADEPRIGQTSPPAETPAVFRAGAALVEVTPTTFPVLVNGGFLQNQATRANDPLMAKCLVLDDGSTRLAVVVVDSCMMPRALLDRAKELAREKTHIATDRILISATHTHSAPAAMGGLGCPADAGYASSLPGKIAEAIERASERLEPARVGWGAIDDPEHTFCRRWVRRPDKMLDDPFGQRNVRANMHPGYQNPDAIAPSGPVDPALTLLSVTARDGGPIAVLANYSMHYYGAEPLSADYFGRFAAALAKRLGGGKEATRPFVALMSQGTSGDQMWMDYGQPKKEPGLDNYGDAVALVAERAIRQIQYRDWVSLAMSETTLVLDRRVPDASRLAWANEVISGMAGRSVPKTLPEVYAQEALALRAEPRRELKLQAIRVGGLGITAIPNEVFAITGLKIKAQSPCETTMNIELANGSEGYIPPPEQHALGGYTTWPARTAGLEVQAEPKIVEALLKLLEEVSRKSRRPYVVNENAYVRAVLASKPTAYWRLDEFQGPAATDFSGHNHHASYEGLVAYYLPGPASTTRGHTKEVNRATYFAGGRVQATIDDLPGACTVELWFWNGLPSDARSITGVLLSLESKRAPDAPSFQLGIDGTRLAQGSLFVGIKGPAPELFFPRKSQILPKTWHHVAVVRGPRETRVYFNGKPELVVKVATDPVSTPTLVCVGGDRSGTAGFEGMIDEIAVYDRELAPEEIKAHFALVPAADRPNRAQAR
jgi:hypothetical protein